MGYLEILVVIVWASFAVGGYTAARKRHRNKWVWSLVCLLTGVLGLCVVLCSSHLEYDEELEYTEEWDLLGWLMLIVAVGATYAVAISEWNRLQNQLFWNNYNVLMGY